VIRVVLWSLVQSPYGLVIIAEDSIAHKDGKPYFVVAKHRRMLNLDLAMRKFDDL
jgi:hypothetical protein